MRLAWRRQPSGKDMAWWWGKAEADVISSLVLLQLPLEGPGTCQGNGVQGRFPDRKQGQGQKEKAAKKTQERDCAAKERRLLWFPGLLAPPCHYFEDISTQRWTLVIWDHFNSVATTVSTATIKARPTLTPFLPPRPLLSQTQSFGTVAFELLSSHISYNHFEKTIFKFKLLQRL